MDKGGGPETLAVIGVLAGLSVAAGAWRRPVTAVLWATAKRNGLVWATAMIRYANLVGAVGAAGEGEDGAAGTVQSEQGG